MNWFKRRPKYLRIGSVMFKAADIEDCQIVTAVEEGGEWLLKIYMKYGNCIIKTCKAEKDANEALEFIWDWVKDL